MRHGLDMLSAGLRFSATNVTGIAQAIDDLAAKLARMPEAAGLVGLAKGGARQRRFDAALLAELDRARKVGAALASSMAWEPVQEEAWHELLQRCIVLHKKEQAPPAGLFELLCAARKIGPAAEVPLDLQAVTVSTWTSVLVGSASPPWLRAFALRRLGAARLV